MNIHPFNYLFGFYINFDSDNSCNGDYELITKCHYFCPGGSDCPAPIVPPPTVYEFELQSELCGRLIGKQGSIVRSIKDTTGAAITVRDHPIHEHLKKVFVVGAADEVRAAIQEIRRR